MTNTTTTATTEAEAEMLDLLDLLTGGGSVEITDGPGSLTGVWLDADLVGSGDTVSEALADAIQTVRGWR